MIQDLAIILIVAGVVTLLFKRLRQPVVLGYIVAGFLVSDKMPYMPSVADSTHSVEEWAEIGVMFLMFGLGLEFSVKKILKQGIAPVRSALVIIGSMMALGFGVGKLFEWTDMNCLFLGGMLAMSSTTIIYKAFDDLDLHHFNFASRVMSVLILEDIFGIVMMVILQAASGGDGGSSISNSILGIIVFLIATFGLGLAFVPMCLRNVRRFMSGETLLIVSLGLCCLVTFISTKLGFSPALGAFLIGSVLAETSDVESIHKVVEPVKNLFGAIFFVSVGMLVDPQILLEYWLPILILVLTIIIGQSTLGSLGFLLGGQTVRGALRSGFSMTQIGEFSFIIATLGLTLGVISDYLYPVVVAVSVITTFTTPYMIKAAERITERIPQNIGDYKLQQKTYIKAPSVVGRAGERFYIQSKINAGSLPQNAHRIMNRDIHITEISLPDDSLWIGKTLMELQLGTIFSVHVSSILRGSKRINIPTAEERLLPHDRLQVVGSDKDLTLFMQTMQSAVYTAAQASDDDMKLIQRVVTPQSIFYGKTLRQLNLRANYSAMLVGLDTGEEKLTVPHPDYTFREADILWLVCESKKESQI